ncbi:MAG: hypothetical protein ACYC4L_09435 [Chloroflexota bacterium]
MSTRSRNSGGANAALGAVLVGLGLLFLVGQFLDVNIGRLAWPLFVIVPGLALCAIALGARGAGEGLFILGSMVTTTGLILLYQNTFDVWESWAYAWALIAPTSVGLGQLVFGLATGRNHLVRNGARVATVGLTIFLVMGAFFELGLRGGGRGLGSLGGFIFPIGLILLGLLLFFSNLFSGRREPVDFATRPSEEVPEVVRPTAEPPSADTQVTITEPEPDQSSDLEGDEGRRQT